VAQKIQTVFVDDLDERVERTGPDHDPEFRVTVELPHLAPAEGLGRSKRAAEQAAAAAMLTHAGVKADRLDG